MIFHFTSQYQVMYGHPGPVPGFELGQYGVPLFFMISGFVILMTVDRSRQAKDFIVSRFSRLYPAYFVCVPITFLLVRSIGLPGREVSTEAAVLNLAMIHQFFKVPTVDGVYWSLQVEVFFYAMMLGMLVFKQLRRVELFFAGLVVLHLADWQLAFADHFPAIRIGVSALRQLLVLDYIALFGCGMLVYRIRKYGWRAYHLPLLALFLVGGVVGKPLAAAALIPFFVGLLWIATGLRAGWLARPSLLYLGAISYPLYLLHQNIGYALMRQHYMAGGHPAVAILTASLIVLALASCVTFCIERPGTRLIREWYRSRPVEAALPAHAVPALQLIPLLSPEARSIKFRLGLLARAYLPDIRPRGSYVSAGASYPGHAS